MGPRERASQLEEEVACIEGERSGSSEKTLQKKEGNWGEGPGSSSLERQGHRKPPGRRRASSELGGRWQALLLELKEPVETGWTWEATCSSLWGGSQLCSMVKSDWEVTSGLPRKLTSLCTPVKSGGEKGLEPQWDGQCESPRVQGGEDWGWDPGRN